MAKVAKENLKKRNTKEELFDLDNEIIIGIKTLPKPKVSKKQQKKKVKEKVKQSKTREKMKTNSNKKMKPLKKAQKQENMEEVESLSSNFKQKKSNKKNVKKKQVIKNSKKKVQEPEEEFELKLGIEDESIKNKNAQKKKSLKEQEIARKKRKIVFRIVKIAMLLFIVIGGGTYFLLSPFFNIKEITASGNEKITSEELVSLSGILLEENIFKIRKNGAEQTIKENAYIEQVAIKRKLPDKIEIQVVERKPSLMITFANAYVYINNQGYMLEVSPNALKLPILTGFSTPEEEIRAGNRLCSEDLQKLEHVLQIIKSAESNGLGEKITKINIADKQNYILELTLEKKKIYLGDDSNLSTKMLYIVSILEENKDIEGEIFVNTDLNNKGAIFRKKI